MRAPLTIAASLLAAVVVQGQNVVILPAARDVPGQAPGIRVIEPKDYEVASVKPHDNAAGLAYASILQSRAGQYHGVNLTVVSLLQSVYGVKPYQLVELPAWSAKDRWEVQITAPGATMRDQAGQILKVLQDRFELRTHVETREFPVYALTRIRADRLGPGVTSPPKDCPGGMSGQMQNWWLKCGDWRMVVDYISGYVDRPLTDRTGISGRFDVQLEWTPPPLGTGTDRVAIAGENLSLFTVIRDQLGVKIDPARGPVDVLVIDHINRPQPD